MCLGVCVSKVHTYFSEWTFTGFKNGWWAITILQFRKHMLSLDNMASTMLGLLYSNTKTYIKHNPSHFTVKKQRLWEGKWYSPVHKVKGVATWTFVPFDSKFTAPSSTNMLPLNPRLWILCSVPPKVSNPATLLCLPLRIALRLYNGNPRRWRPSIHPSP